MMLFVYFFFFFFFKQKTAYEIRKGDWSSDVCSSDLRTESCGCDRMCARSHCRIRKRKERRALHPGRGKPDTETDSRQAGGYNGAAVAQHPRAIRHGTCNRRR